MDLKEEIFNKSPVGILYFDKNGDLIEANTAAQKIAKHYSLKDFKEFNLLNNPLFNKTKLNKDNITKIQIPTDANFLEWTISSADPGFLVFIQRFEEPCLEDKYRSWFEDDLTGDFIATTDGRILECNPAFIDIYGFGKRDKALKANISKFNPQDWANMIHRLENEPKIYDYQSWHKIPLGRKIHVVANVVGIYDNSGKLNQVKGYIFDDTERKKNEEALRESEEKYHRLFDEDLTGDFIAKTDGDLLECNPAFAEIYGFYDLETAIKWNISQSNPFDWPYMVTRIKSEGKLSNFQSWQRRSDGRRIHVVSNLVGIFDDTGKLINIKGYVFDDTERKNAEEELNRSKTQIKEIVDSIKDGFIAIDHQWHLVYVNKCAGEYLGIDSEDLLEQNLWERFPEFKGTTYEKIFRNAIEKQESQHFEAYGGLKPDRWYSFSIYPNSEGISVFWRDITHEKYWKK